MHPNPEGEGPHQGGDDTLDEPIAGEKEIADLLRAILRVGGNS
jgi:hypothetical protein